MLRQLQRLTRAVPHAGTHASALAVYASADGTFIRARESGEEGVACIDDAARALGLMCDLWHATQLPWVRLWAESLLEFVLWMQQPNGDFPNFLHDWNGRRNVEGRTSLPGGAFWQARGLRGVARAWLVLGDSRAADSCLRALERVRTVRAAPDVRAIHVTVALDLVRAGRVPSLRDDLVRWCLEVASARRGDVLSDSDSDTVHLWGHSQEAVLADAGAFLDRGDLVEIARRSAEAVFVPVIASSFDLPQVQPYGVACAVRAMDALAAATGDVRYRGLATDARAWFDGRNSAHRPVYDRATGAVADGIDDGRVSLNSGAESNVLGAQALFAEVVRSARGFTWRLP